MAEADTKELDALLAALNKSAERLQTLWFSFLGITIYFAITALTTTHRMLLLNEPQVLPILNMKVPLLPFYFIAPLFYVVIHFYTLMMLVLLARTAAPFEGRLTAAFPLEAEQERYRARAENALLLQLLIGRKEEREGFNGRLLAAIALITLAIAPVVVLILMQMMFLPYHHLEITWWHRAMVVIDLGLVMTQWASYRYQRGLTRLRPLFWRLDRPANWRQKAALRFVSMLLVFWACFWEGRWAGENGIYWIGRGSYIEANLDTGRSRYAATENGAVFWMLPYGGFPDRLKLDDEIIVGEKRLEEVQKERASRGQSADFVPTYKFDGRDFQAALLRGADLRGVSMRGLKTRLDGADLSMAQLQRANLRAAQMQGTVLLAANLQGADLAEALTRGANLSGALMQNANLTWTQLQGANLFGVQLQGARLAGAQLQGADLFAAQLLGADLSNAEIQGANMRSAYLQGAALTRAKMNGADLSGTELKGADLVGAHLLGALLSNTHMQGANLNEADVQGAVIQNAFAFRIATRNINLRGSLVRDVRADRVKSGPQPLELTREDISAWTAAAVQFVANENQKMAISTRFLKLDPDARNSLEDAADVMKWKNWETESRQSDPDGAAHRRRLATILGDAACDANGAPYVARGFIRPDAFRSVRLAELREHLDSVRERLKRGRQNPESCPGVVGLTEQIWQQLDAIEPTTD